MRNREEIKRYRTYLVCDQCGKGTKFVHDEGDGTSIPDGWPTGWFVSGSDGRSLDFCSEACTGTYYDGLRRQAFRTS